MGGILIRTDLKVKHHDEARRRAIELFRSGRGCDVVARAGGVE